MRVSSVWVSSETVSLLQDEMPYRKSGVYGRNVFNLCALRFFKKQNSKRTERENEKER